MIEGIAQETCQAQYATQFDYAHCRALLRGYRFRHSESRFEQSQKIHAETPTHGQSAPVVQNAGHTADVHNGEPLQKPINCGIDTHRIPKALCSDPESEECRLCTTYY